MESSVQGSHILLDCTGTVEFDGQWMLALMEKAVAESGARLVHSHVEIFDGSISPPGFAAVVLLDESHVTTHCYSEKGLLAIDAFTCGSTDPSLIIDVIERELKTSMPELNISQRRRHPRFLKTSGVGGVKRFVDEHFHHFNAGALKDAADSLQDFLAKDGKLMITLAGAMSTAELGRSLAPLIRSGKVHAISCTGANLEEDIFNLVARNSYQRVQNWRSLSLAEEQELHNRGLNRVTDTCIPEEEAIRHVEKLIIKSWKSCRAFPHQHLMSIIDQLEYDVPAEHSWLLAAMDANIPVYVPGWEDSTLGNIFASHCMSGECNASAVKSGVDYMMHLAKWYQRQDSPVGLLQIGGGIAGDFPICVVPMLRQDLKKEVDLWGWFGQISESNASYGGYSGAHPSEKITWGKLSPETPMHIIESDATIVAPILFSYLLEC